MKSLFILTACTIASSSIFATNNPPPQPTYFNPTFSPKLDVDTSSSSSSNSKATSNSNQSQNNSPSYDGGKSNFYFLPMTSGAAPLPATICPQGDSLDWSIGWNFFHYATSSTRTEMACLDKLLKHLKETAPIKQVEYRLPIPENIHPVCTTTIVPKTVDTRGKKVSCK